MIDRAGLERLYRQYSRVVFRRARRLLGDAAAARDVCQDVFIEILRARPSWSPPSPMAWIYATTTNKCLNVLRERRRCDRALASAPVPAAVVMPGFPVTLVLGNLPDELQEIAIYYGIDGMNQEEIALVLGISQKTVSNRIQEIRARLSRPDGDRTAEAT